MNDEFILKSSSKRVEKLTFFLPPQRAVFLRFVKQTAAAVPFRSVVADVKCSIKYGFKDSEHPK